MKRREANSHAEFIVEMQKDRLKAAIAKALLDTAKEARRLGYHDGWHDKMNNRSYREERDQS